MSIYDLPQDLINVLVFNYEIVAKSLILVVLFSFSIFYLFVWKKNYEKKTPWLVLMFLRFCMSLASYVTLIVSPLTIFVLNPYFELKILIHVMITFYRPIFILSIVLIVVEIISVFPMWVVSQLGADIQDGRIKAILNKVFPKKKDDWK